MVILASYWHCRLRNLVLTVLPSIFWHEKATSTIISNTPNQTVSFVRFQKLFLFWLAGTIFEGWEAELEGTHSFEFQFGF